MGEERTHHAATTDGISIVGTVHGQGPSIVFWHGAYGDGALDWKAVITSLTDRFACHLPSWRGRGLSGDHPDLSYDRRVQDVVDYVESLGEPVGLVGWSGGGNPALAAAARSEAVRALAPYEPTMGSVMTNGERRALRDAIGRMGGLAAGGDMGAAIRAAAEFPSSAVEATVIEGLGYFDAVAHHVPNLLNVFGQLRDHRGPTADDPDVLAAITVPVTVVYGTATRPLWIRGARHVVEHVPEGRVHPIPDVGHFGPLTDPAAVADAFGEAFS